MKFNQCKQNLIGLGFAKTILIALFLANISVQKTSEQNLAFCYLPSNPAKNIYLYSPILNKLKKIKGLSFQTKHKIAHSIYQASSQTGLSENLLFELIKKESSFRPNAISPMGARGLTQLMPSTAKHFCNLALSEIHDIEKNISCGAQYLSLMLKDFNGDLQLALVAYNTGPAPIHKIQKKYAHKKSFKEIKYLIHPQARHYAISINNSYLKTV